MAAGAGSAARRSMGTGVVGGMLVATLVAVLFIPLFYRWVSREKRTPDPDETQPISAHPATTERSAS